MASKRKVKKQKVATENDISTTTLGGLKKFIAAIEKKYGKGAEEFPVEVHRPYKIDGEKETFWAPHELQNLAVAQYEGEEFKTVVIR